MQNLLEVLGDEQTLAPFASSTMLVDTVVPCSRAATDEALMPVSATSCWMPSRIPTD
jgi:hypothetical protein